MTLYKEHNLTPGETIEYLKKGNKRFYKNLTSKKDFPSQLTHTKEEQYPKAVIFTCVDSRVPVEYIFDLNIGDVFVIRVAGNVVNDDILASTEFGCKIAGAKLILVLGHENCGAVKSAISQVKLGHISGLLEKIEPAINQSQEFCGEKVVDNADYVKYVAIKNVEHTLDEIRLKSSILSQMEKDGEIKMLGAIYSLSSGKVTFFED